jgi:hypothetical protein
MPDAKIARKVSKIDAFVVDCKTNPNDPSCQQQTPPKRPELEATGIKNTVAR